ncbi:putative sugar nucleotidyl transferase [Deminuibacter soli]|uniref:Glucose-1-phosphate thymidylyltransferase n=1 Tax=Deminuibacter soli TaxID=2291815 RepID=A0A3E1NJK9_9BACT|nr:putative sugar nucleotidyl transferase [Deminuibacter soli]RFM28120.1 glucose-1-phosphate thymidylyltransferase [Deminuibacter soli]
MALVLFDNEERSSLFPLSHTRSVSDLRIGILRIREKWELLTGQPVFVFTESYLQHLYPAIPAGEHTWVDAAVLPDAHIVEAVLQLTPGEALQDDRLIAGRIDFSAGPLHTTPTIALFSLHKTVETVKRLHYPWQIFLWNDVYLRNDFTLLTRNRVSQPIPPDCRVANTAQVFIEEGAVIEYATLNATEGPIYIGKNALVMDGACIRGPFAMCEKAVIKMGAKIYGATTIGPYCSAGGEIKNVVLTAFSNKAHDGYLGDSVIGEWCNMGAGTSNSNVKNTGGEVKVWHSYSDKMITVGIKCGLVMGDYSRTAINTAINTGSVIGTCCNVFSEGLTPRLIPDFVWGTRGLTRYEFDKALRDINNWKKMKHQSLTNEETAVLKHIFEHFSQQTVKHVS